ncbi:serine/threonine-protein kinase [Nonomuraea sp. NPDC050383]|uniref:serine/threonine-protein kinase n=1 Tax=Nonomuraea sp. NPDC050383 TaxID=3364362 RepID=UPI0037B83B46
MSEHLGPYHLLSRLGSGGFGEVHLALDPEGRTVAVKVLHPHVAADTVALARLAREVETMRRVGGPYVAEVLDASLDVARPYLVTRYVQGRPLSAVPVPVADLPRLAAGLAAALLAMHEAEVIHRDLKPANVMMAEGRAVVIDFGIASALDSLSVTASGAVVGTPGYLAPEVLEGHEAGMAADVFSFGATLAYAATGRQPYGQGPASAVAYRVVHHEPDLEGTPEWLEPLLRRCLSTDPAERPTAAELCTQLGALAGPARAGAVEAHDGQQPPATSPAATSTAASAAFSPSPGAFVPGASVPGDSVPGKSVLGESVPGGSAGGALAAGVPPLGGAAAGGPAVRPRPADLPRERRRSRAERRREGLHDLETREWRPGDDPRRRSAEESMARHREKVRRRWVIGSALFVALLAAAAREPLPEVALFLLAGYTLAVVADAGVALFSRRPYRTSRIVVDFASIAGAAGLCLGLSAAFSTFTLALFAGTALVVGIVFLLSA